jgi:TonB family protein
MPHSLKLAAAALLLALSFAYADVRQPATEAYQAQTQMMIVQLAAPKFLGHLDAMRDSGPVKLTYRVRASGSVESVRIIAGNPRSFVVQTFVSTIRSAKFPPIPKAVLKEQGKSYLDVYADLTMKDYRR